MSMLCRTSKGRIVCGLGGGLIALLALACLWASSPSVTAGDGPPAANPKETGRAEAPAPVPQPPPSVAPLPPCLGGAVSRETAVMTPLTRTPLAPPTESQDIKQLMAQLNEIRANRTKLEEQERLTIQAIRRKVQEQKKSLAQLELDLRQLGVALEENVPDRAPVQQAGFEVLPPPASTRDPLLVPDLPRSERKK